MSLLKWVAGATTISAAALTYGCVFESNRLVITRREIALPRWPKRLHGYRIVVLGDFHVRCEYSVALASRAVETALDLSPDAIALVGDYVSRYKPEWVQILGELFEPLLLMQGKVVAIPGNHDYIENSCEITRMIFEELSVHFLDNKFTEFDGILWGGVASANAGHADADFILDHGRTEKPMIALWHEPDVNDLLEGIPDLILSGHSHGGQFLMPWGTPFIGSENGMKFRRGYFDATPSPLYVTSGVGTTGPPSRLFCPPEVVELTIHSPSR